MPLPPRGIKSAVPLPDGVRHYRSFASKYAHFFINHYYPIRDTYALVALREHVGHKALAAEPSYPVAEPLAVRGDIPVAVLSSIARFAITMPTKGRQLLGTAATGV
jgi:hypothetical protein